MATNEATTQMVWGPGTFGFSRAELEVSLPHTRTQTHTHTRSPMLIHHASCVRVRIGGIRIALG